jgi:cell division septation protein DedD
MARDWRRLVLAALAAAMLAGACALGGGHGAFAQHADEQAEEQDEGKENGKDTGKKGKKKQDPAEAQRIVEVALKQLQAGKVGEAVQAVTATVAAGNLPPAIMAKALYVRGMAYRKMGRPALAISDLSGALWLKGGLGGDEREDAKREKAAAYADAGLADPGESRPAQKSAGSGNWFSGMFGGLGSTPDPPPRKAEKVERAEPPTSIETPQAKVAVGTPWSSATETQETTPKAAPPKKAPPPKAPPKAAPPAAPKATKAPAAQAAAGIEGRYLVQLTAMKTEAEALALAARAKREHGALLGSRKQSIDRKVFGNMGAFYRVRFGPFATAQETQAVCARLQGSGIDCLPLVNQ